MTASTVTPARVPMRPLRREVPRLDSDYSTATVLCGEISLGAAVVADEWVTAHEQLGRNRP